jgi:hypothetical protein
VVSTQSTTGTYEAFFFFFFFFIYSAMASLPLGPMHNRDRTAFLYPRGRRLKAWFTRRRIGSRRQFVLGQSADAGLSSLHDTLEKLGC